MYLFLRCTMKVFWIDCKMYTPRLKHQFETDTLEKKKKKNHHSILCIIIWNIIIKKLLLSTLLKLSKKIRPLALKLCWKATTFLIITKTVLCSFPTISVKLFLLMLIWIIYLLFKVQFHPKHPVLDFRFGIQIVRL